MRLGIIARCDEGGLGSQTWEYARHLAPDVLLVLSVPPPRGQELPERFDGLAPIVFRSQFPPADGELVSWRAFAQSCDVILTAETCYLRDFPTICRQENTRLVVHANPELWEWGSNAPFTTWAPTPWLLSRLPPNTPVIPVPVDRDRCARRTITKVNRLLHISSPAMLDRNGSELLSAAIPFCRTSFELLVAGPKAPEGRTYVGNVLIVPVPEQRNYWELYQAGDALVLPRKYGGLCLPMQEAASSGMPVISIGVQPQAAWLAPALSVPFLGRERGAMMKGGVTPTWCCDPETLAYTIDCLVAGEGLDAGLEASEQLATSLDWEHWAPRYRTLLEAL